VRKEKKNGKIVALLGRAALFGDVTITFMVVNSKEGKKRRRVRFNIQWHQFLE
jgi:hypothetical protein